MSGLNVLVTGGAGFVGSHVVDRAMSEGSNVWVVDNLYTGRMENLTHHVGHPRFHFINHDVGSPFAANVTSIKFDRIFHLACAASPVHYQAEPIHTTLTCVNGTNNALLQAQRCDCPILISSTSEVYGDPDVHPQPESYVGAVSCNGVRSCYDEGKRCGEALCMDYHRKHGVKVRVARIFNTYGPRMCFNDGRIISNFLVQALQGDDITVYGTGEYTRSFQFCTDLVEGFWRLINHPTETGPVNIGNPVEYSVNDMAKMIKGMVADCSSEIVYKEAAKDDPKQRRPDITKAAEVLGWKPTVLVAEGLAKTMAEFKSRLDRENASAKKIYVECNPLLDISAHVDADFLKKFGLEPASAALCTPEQMPIYAALEERKDVAYIPGGSGLNTARVAQWMTQAAKQSTVSYVGCIADDKYGALLKEAAESEGVSMPVAYSAGNPTGSCAVCIVGKERSLLANLAAANDLKVEHLDTAPVKQAISAANIFYFTGFTLTISKDHVLKVAKRALAKKAVFSMNLSAPFIIDFFPLMDVMPYVDIVFSNDDEAKAMAKKQGWDTTDIQEIAQKVAALPKEGSRPRLVVFTQGSEQTIAATATSVQTVAVPAIAAEKIIDTNGAGDSFVGGFLAALALDQNVEDCCKAGHYAAGVIIQNDGCTFPAVPAYTI